MNEKVRFGVKSQDGRTSNVWTCWCQFEKRDIYLTNDVLGKGLKLSDHPTGRSHIAFHYEKRDELFTPQTLPNERFVMKQENPKRADEVCRLVARVIFPAGSQQPVAHKATDDTVWLPEACEGQAIEVDIFRFNVETIANSWPGKHEGANFIAHLPFAGPGCIYIVWRASKFQMPPPLTNAGTSGLFKGCSEEDFLNANRAVLFGRTETGAFSLIETAVAVKQSNSLIADAVPTMSTTSNAIG